eukprot:6524395-Prymnesium_polylepis.1
MGRLLWLVPQVEAEWRDSGGGGPGERRGVVRSTRLEGRCGDWTRETGGGRRSIGEVAWRAVGGGGVWTRPSGGRLERQPTGSWVA